MHGVCLRAPAVIAGVLSFSAWAVAAPPENDLCSGAIPLTLGAPFMATSAGATSDIAESACGFNDSADVWFTFTSTEFNNFRIQTSPSSAIDTTLAVYSACGGTLRACNDDSPDRAPGEHWSRVDVQLSPNQTIRIRVAGWAGATGPFTIQVDHVPVPHPANDDCASALALAFPSSTNTTTVGCTATSETDITSCGEDDSLDAWYSFTPPDTGVYEFFATNTDIFGLFFSVWPSCTAAPGTEIACGLRDVAVPLNAGQAVLIRAAFIGGVAGDFTMNVGPLPSVPPPANDNCSGALPLLGPGTYQGTTVGATGFDTGSIFGCTFTDTGPGVWYRFVAPAPGYYLFDTNGSALDDTAMALFGACDVNGNGVDLQGCDDNLGDLKHSRVLWQAADAGQAVYIVVTGQHHTTGDFQINVTQDPQPPVNDRCFNAIPITVNTPVNGDNFLAESIDVTPSVCDEGLFPMFYSFVAPADGTYRFEILDGSDLPYAAVAIYDACLGNELVCGPNRFVRLAMRAGESVIVRVSGSLYYRDKFVLGIVPDEPGPANDRCDAAAPLGFAQSIHATNRGATGSVTTGNCASPEATDPADVWYSFTAPADGDYTFSATGAIHPGLSLYDGCWPAAPDAIACVDGCQSPAMLTQTLAAGQSVSIRVRGCFLGFDAPNEFGSFTLSVGSESIGACCAGTTCRLDSAIGCASDHFAGAGVACSATGATPCCRADFNHDGQPAVQDIFDFLNAWFAGDARADFNGGGLDVQDIFDFLNAWFAGC
jgi:hypothetical protein